MPDDELRPIGESVEEALLRILRPDLLDQYRKEKERHREELRAIEQARKRARQMIRRLFGGLRERKETELEQEYLERVQGEDDRHARFMEELRETHLGLKRRKRSGPSVAEKLQAAYAAVVARNKSRKFHAAGETPR